MTNPAPDTRCGPDHIQPNSSLFRNNLHAMILSSSCSYSHSLDWLFSSLSRERAHGVLSSRSGWKEHSEGVADLFDDGKRPSHSLSCAWSAGFSPSHLVGLQAHRHSVRLSFIGRGCRCKVLLFSVSSRKYGDRARFGFVKVYRSHLQGRDLQGLIDLTRNV